MSDYNFFFAFSQDIVLTLVSANNGGVINQERENFTISVRPNDNPHGTVEFALEDNILIEPEMEETQYVRVARMWVSLKFQHHCKQDIITKTYKTTFSM